VPLLSRLSDVPLASACRLVVQACCHGLAAMACAKLAATAAALPPWHVASLQPPPQCHSRNVIATA